MLSLREKIIRIFQKIDEIFIIHLHLYIRKIYPRLATRFIKRNLGKGLIGLEIGTDKGINAKNLLETLSIKKLYLIDSYEDPVYKKK